MGGFEAGVHGKDLDAAGEGEPVQSGEAPEPPDGHHHPVNQESFHWSSRAELSVVGAAEFLEGFGGLVIENSRLGEDTVSFGVTGRACLSLGGNSGIGAKFTFRTEGSGGRGNGTAGGNRPSG